MAWVERDGLRLYYEVEGRGMPMILLHGLGTSSELWWVGGWVDALSSRRRLVMVDARGQGRSQKPTDVRAYEMSQHAADVVAVMDALEIGTAPLLGFSLGGATALLVAAQFPTRVSAVITMGARPTSAEFADVPAGDPTPTLEAGALFREHGMSWIVELLENEGRPQWAALMRDSDASANALQHEAWAAPGQATALLSAIRAPVLMVWGEREKPEPLPRLPDAARVLVVPDADHAGTLEALDLVVPAVLSFLGEAAA